MQSFYPETVSDDGVRNYRSVCDDINYMLSVVWMTMQTEYNHVCIKLSVYTLFICKDSKKTVYLLFECSFYLLLNMKRHIFVKQNLQFDI